MGGQQDVLTLHRPGDNDGYTDRAFKMLQTAADDDVQNAWVRTVMIRELEGTEVHLQSPLRPLRPAA